MIILQKVGRTGEISEIQNVSFVVPQVNSEIGNGTYRLTKYIIHMTHILNNMFINYSLQLIEVTFKRCTMTTKNIIDNLSAVFIPFLTLIWYIYNVVDKGFLKLSYSSYMSHGKKKLKSSKIWKKNSYEVLL